MVYEKVVCFERNKRPDKRRKEQSDSFSSLFFANLWPDHLLKCAERCIRLLVLCLGGGVLSSIVCTPVTAAGQFKVFQSGKVNLRDLF